MFVAAIGKLFTCHRIAFTLTGVCGPFRKIGYFRSLRSDSLFFSKRFSLVTKSQNISQTGRLPFEVDTRVSKDVLLFKYENQRFFSILSFFGVSQFVFWLYLSHFSYTTLRDVRQDDTEVMMTASQKNEDAMDLSMPEKKEPTTLVWWRRINFGENKYRIGLTVLCASIGYVILAGSTLYTMRMVRTLTLVKGGQRVRVVTYTPWFRNKVIDVPLNELSCQVSRDQSKSHLPIKIRGYWMFFLLDSSGTYMNTKLFDYTAGLNRLWIKQK